MYSGNGLQHPLPLGCQKLLLLSCLLALAFEISSGTLQVLHFLVKQRLKGTQKQTGRYQS